MYNNTYRAGTASHKIYEKLAFTDLFTEIYFFPSDYADGKISNKHKFLYIIRDVCKKHHFKIKVKLHYDETIMVKRLI